MFEVLTGGAELYDGLYDKGSDWIHSGPETIFNSLEDSEWGIKDFTGKDVRVAAQALMAACLSFGMTQEGDIFTD